MAAERGRGRTGLRVGLAILAVAGIAVLSRTLPLATALQDLVGWVRGAGLAGAAVFALVYIGATVSLLPASILTLAAGFVYGPVRGTALVSPTSVVAAMAAFLLGRSLARDWVERKVAQRPLFAAIDAAIGNSGLRIVALLRLSPLFPFNLLNYALSLTRVRARDYLLGSFVGMLPGTFLYVYLGSLASNLTDLAAGKTPPSTGKQVLFWGGLAATAVVTTLITRLARRALLEALPARAAKL